MVVYDLYCMVYYNVFIDKELYIASERCITKETNYEHKILKQ